MESAAETVDSTIAALKDKFLAVLREAKTWVTEANLRAEVTASEVGEPAIFLIPKISLKSGYTND